MEGMDNQPLNREGIFKAKPLSWNVRKEKSGSVGISIEFLIQAQFDNGEWVSWEEAAPHSVRGTYYVVKKDSTINMTTVKQLKDALGWRGDLEEILDLPPNVEVQITVKGEDYNNATIYKAGWMNPGDYVPTFGASTEDVKELQSRFGSLLRAAASAAK